MRTTKVRIRLRAYDHRVIDQSAEKITETARRTGARVSGPIPLPTNIRRFCVIRGPHIDKESMEHFELRTHNRLIDILEPTNKTIDGRHQVFLKRHLNGLHCSYLDATQAWRKCRLFQQPSGQPFRHDVTRWATRNRQ